MAVIQTPPSHHRLMVQDLIPDGDDGIPLPLDEGWTAVQRDLAAASDLPTPIADDGDPLHLSMHTAGPLEVVAASVQLRRSGRESRSGVLVCDSAVGWYRALIEDANMLPSISDHRWCIDVVIRPIG